MIDVPIPAANSIAAHENVEKSGVELSGPNLMLPKRVRARTMTKTIAAVIKRI